MTKPIDSPNQEVSVRLFGAFRQFSDASFIRVEVPDACRVSDLRSAFARALGDNDNALALLKASAFATDQAVLDDEEPLPRNQALSVLPPVCGG